MPPYPNVPAPSLRVVHVIDSLNLGGTETNAVRTALALHQRGIPVEMAVGRSGPLASRLVEAGVEIREFPLSGIAHWTAIRAIAAFARYCRSVRADVVHCHDVYSNTLFTIGARLGGVPLVIASRRWGLAQYPPALTSSSRMGYRFAHRVLANSASVAASIIADEHVSAHRVVTVPNFVDDALWTIDQAHVRAQLRAELGIANHVPVVSMVARLSPEKNHLLAVASFARVAAVMPSAQLLLVGGGPTSSAVHAAIDQHGLTERVRMLGERMDGWRYHVAADVALLTSLREGFPNTVVEAMAVGRPVVSTDVGGVRDALTTGVNGWVVERHEPALVAAGVLEYLQHPERAIAVGAAAKLFARANFSEDAVMARLLTLYGECLPRSAAVSRQMAV